MDNQEKSPSPNRPAINKEKLLVFFTDHLNKVYAAKVHLLRKLPMLMEEANFKGLRHAIAESIEDIEKQIARMEVIFTLLDEEITVESCRGMLGLVDDAFESIVEYKGDAALSDLSLLYYMQNIESIEMASFQILQIAAVKLKNKQVVQLLRENYDEAKADRTLMLLIAAKYLSAK
jgi:ferritin-like metal-binding protein YciE